MSYFSLNARKKIGELEAEVVNLRSGLDEMQKKYIEERQRNEDMLATIRNLYERMRR